MIDIQSITLEITKLKEEKSDLEKSSAQLQELQRQKQEIEKQENTHEEQKEKALSQKGAVENELSGLRNQHEKCRAILKNHIEEKDEELLPLIEKKLVKIILDLENIDDTQTKINDRFIKDKAKNRNDAERVSNEAIEKMANYMKDFPQESTELNAKMEAIRYFCLALDTLRKEKLPEYEKRFKKLLQENVINDIVGFKADLENQEAEIRIKIDELNNALKMIEYTPSTYIQLGYKGNADQEILGFKEMLKNCIPDAGEESLENNEQSFTRITELIRRFDDEERWRLKVTDVRNWLNFYASERYSEDHKEKEFYESSSGKSGGQTVKLAYTILASAIAYQFGLDSVISQQPGRSFRFVVIDEVFNNLDRNNSQYAMELFQRLNLQLLIVTPLDKINLVEPFIATCHLVTKNEARNHSRVYNLTKEELETKRKQLIEKKELSMSLR